MIYQDSAKPTGVGEVDQGDLWLSKSFVTFVMT